MNATGPTPDEWRAAMGYFPTGVTVVTSWEDDVAVGTTVNAFCSVSLEPPMLLICLSDINPLRGPVRRSGVFGVNILSSEGHGLAMRFARNPKPARIDASDYHSLEGGAPQLLAAPVFIDCVVDSHHQAGDHLVIVGRGTRTIQSRTVPPLLYHKGEFPTFDPLG